MADPALPSPTNTPGQVPPGLPPEEPGIGERLRRIFFGKPRDLTDRSLFHRLSLVALLAWVGLGADGLSSSSYGPEEAFRALGEHTYLAIALAVAVAGTVFIIAWAYSHIIEHFPEGGGGYVVATKLLGPHTGVVSGSALVVDYVLTITVSLAAAGDALFSFMPASWLPFKVLVEVGFVAALIVLNIRGVKESIIILTPIFILFLLTHVTLIIGGFFTHAGDLPAVASSVSSGFSGGLGILGIGGMMMLLFRAYSLGGGTYTGLEAVSNGLIMMREPRVATGKRTMAYMAASLVFTASGLLICYLLFRVSPETGKTLNAVLVGRFAENLPFGGTLVVLTLISEGALLVVAAQAGFLDGPRVMSKMAVDWWLPRRFAALSERLTTQNGILLMGGASLVALLATGGNVHHLVVMYSINVFLTFSLSMLSMCRFWWQKRRTPDSPWIRRLGLFIPGLLLCSGILIMTAFEKFYAGGWITLVVTGGMIGLCFLIRSHYRSVTQQLQRLDEVLENIPPKGAAISPKVDAKLPTAAVLVGSFGGLGIHTLLSVQRAFPNHYKNLLFLSVGVLDSDTFKGADEVDALRHRTEGDLQRYVDYAHKLGLPATSRASIGTDAVDEIEELCRTITKDFPKVTFFAGQLIFKKETWYHRLLHNETAFAIQKRLHWSGMTMVILPVRVY
ncbi:MAG: APC family permease [candidate division Zixibacteria bacterium]|nr:APC family permease [candidate division Zixibacteria bacterium]